MPRAAKPKPRRRLDAQSARALILDAAEKRLVLVGPSGIRLQDVAADAGVAHPTVLHHFGSRELLVKAVITRALGAINAAIVQALAAASGDDEKLETMIANIGVALEASGHARVVLWLALEGQRIEGAEVRLSDVVDATHALRAQRLKGRKKAPREDTARAVVLAALTLVTTAVLGPSMLENAGLAHDSAAVEQFRRWVARLLMAHLDA